MQLCEYHRATLPLLASQCRHLPYPSKIKTASCGRCINQVIPPFRQFFPLRSKRCEEESNSYYIIKGKLLLMPPATPLCKAILAQHGTGTGRLRACLRVETFKVLQGGSDGRVLGVLLSSRACSLLWCLSRRPTAVVLHLVADVRYRCSCKSANAEINARQT